MSAILRIGALMLLIYLLANFLGDGEIFRHSSGFLLLTAISAGVYLLFKPNKKKTSITDRNQQNAPYNSIKIEIEKPVRNTGTGFIYGFIAFIIVVYLFRDFLGNISFQFFLFIDNLLRISYASDPVFMWAILGLFTGLVCGSFVAWKKYRLAFKVNLIPAAILLLIIFILIKMNEP